MKNRHFINFVVLLIGVALTLAAPLWAQPAGPVVSSLSKQEEAERVRISVNLSGRVSPQVSLSGQRVDLVLPQATLRPGVAHLPEDATLIKTLFINRRGDLVLSFLFRSPPQRAEAVYDAGRSQVVVDVLWSGAPQRLALMPQIGGMMISQDGQAVGRRTRTSGYADDWRRFFRDYETALPFAFKPHYSLPALIPLSQRPESHPIALAQAQEAGMRGDWQEALGALRGVVSTSLSPEHAAFFFTLRAEALLRTGAHRQGRSQLQEFVETHPRHVFEGRARYLYAYALAVNGDPHGAMVQLMRAREVQGADSSLAHFLVLLEGELHLAMGRDQKALELLDGAALPGAADDLRQLARAAALTGVGRFSEALAAYQDLELRYGQLRDPFALERYARSLYRQKQFAEAAGAYARLAPLSDNRDAEGLAYFAQVRALLRAGDERGARFHIDRIQENFPGSRAARRATLLQSDLAVLRGEDQGLLWAILDYGRIAEESDERALREEAAFKHALALHFKQDRRASVEALELFIRNHFSGALRLEAEVLLGDLLPGFIDELIGEGEHLQALVLLERNREILLDQRISWEFLKGLAAVFRDTELLDRAIRVYLFMLDNVREMERGEPLYLPLVRLLAERGRYEMAIQYAERYAETFVDGEDRDAVLLTQARALHATGRSELAAELLLAAERPGLRDLDLWGGRICFELGRYEEAAGCLTRLVERTDAQPEPQELLLLAEALYRAGRYQQALSYFESLRQYPATADQAAYRSALIYLELGERARALKVLQQLVDEGSNELWRRLSREKIELLALKG